MGRKKSYVTMSDHFCGAGGSGWGAKQALDKVGGVILYGANHWKLATESYGASNISKEVECTDLSASDPRRFPSTDGSIWSPECTTHSPAGGNTHKQLKKQMELFNSNKIDPSTERSRATMWDVCRFAEYHKYNFLICENVVEVKTRWVLFEDWLRAMHTLGYNHKCVYLNSMFFYPTPQSRDRIYIVFWKKGNKEPELDYTPQAYCHTCERDVYAVQCWKNSSKQFGKYGSHGQYVYCCPGCSNIVEPYYYAAFNCIDWTDIGTKIGDRKKELSIKTTRRIQHGLDTYGNEPFLMNNDHTHAGHKKKLRSAFGAMRTQVTKLNSSIITPWIIEMNSTGECKPADKAASTITAGGINHAILAAPFIINCKGESTSKPVTSTAWGFTTKPSQGIVTDESWNSFVSYFNGNGGNKPIHKSTPTQATKGRLMLVNYKKPKIEDCYYRMFKAKEVKKGMAFDDAHVILGNTADQIKQCGAAVTPPVMEWLTQQCINSLK